MQNTQNETRKAIQNFYGEIPTDLPNDSVISIDRNQPEKVYGLGFQPAKSIPEIPRWFLRKYISRNSVIFDPFAGSGTTLIETLKHGSTVYWLDYNPLSKLICRVKTKYYDCFTARKLSDNFLLQVRNEEKFKNTVELSNKEFWFQKPVIKKLEILKANIFKLDANLQPLFWLAFSLTVRKMSNMNDSMILAARRPNVEDVPERSEKDVVDYFKSALNRTIDAIEEWNALLNGNLSKAKEIDEDDARCFNGKWKCDAIITSPPYINAIDYVWASKFELHWLNFVKSNEDRLNLYSKEIGTERIPSQEYKELGQTGHEHLDELIKEIYFGSQYKASKGQNQLRARVVYRYFEDMKKHFGSCYQHLPNKGYYCFSVGDFSRICGVSIPVANILADIAQDIGFEEIFRFHLILKKRKLNIPRNVQWANTIKYDTTIVLERK